MKMRMKKLCSLLLAGMLVMGTAACGSEKEAQADTGVQTEAEEEALPASDTEEEAEDGENREEENLEDADPVLETSGEEGINDNENRKDQYMGTLLDLCMENRLPDGSAVPSPTEGASGKMSDNRFAVCDIDGDGKRELIIQYVTAPTAGMMELIYDYDNETKSVREQLREYPLLTYYDNGMIEAGWSHNQGLSGDTLWPYTLWEYDAEADAYRVAAEVEAWDRKISETDPGWNISFPEEIDADGDGVVYYVRPEGVSDYIDPIDGPEYEQWRDSCLGDAKTVDVAYGEMTEQNIYMIE